MKKLEKECEKTTLKYAVKHKKRNLHCFFYLLAMIIVSLFIASLAIITYTPRSEYKIWTLINENSSEPVDEKIKVAKEAEIQQIRYNLVLVFLSTVSLILLLFLVAFFCRSSSFSSAVQAFRLIFFVAFTKLPLLNRGVGTLNGSLIDSSKTSFEFSHRKTLQQHISYMIFNSFAYANFFYLNKNFNIYRCFIF